MKHFFQEFFIRVSAVLAKFEFEWQVEYTIYMLEWQNGGFSVVWFGSSVAILLWLGVLERQAVCG